MYIYQRKDSPYWWCRFRDPENGRRIQRSTRVDTTQSKRTARAAAERIQRAELLRAEQGEPLEMGHALMQLHASKQRAGRAQATLDIVRQKGKQLCRVMGHGRDCKALVLGDVDAYMDLRLSEGVTRHTIAKEVGILLSALRLAKKHDQWSGDPASLRPDGLKEVYQPRDRWLTVDEYRRLYLAAYLPRRDHLVAFVYLGVRHSELFRIEAQHLDHKKQRVFVDGTKTKRSKRWVPCIEDVWDVLAARAERRPSGPLFEPWLVPNMVQSLDRWCKRAGIERVTANDLRRTFVSWMFNAGIQELVTVRLVGHTDSKMVRRVYAQLADETSRAAVSALPSIHPKKRQEEA